MVLVAVTRYPMRKPITNECLPRSLSPYLETKLGETVDRGRVSIRNQQRRGGGDYHMSFETCYPYEKERPIDKESQSRRLRIGLKVRKVSLDER